MTRRSGTSLMGVLRSTIRGSTSSRPVLGVRKAQEGTMLRSNTPSMVDSPMSPSMRVVP